MGKFNRHQARAERYIKEHGFERKEDTPSIASRIKSRIKQRYEDAQAKRAYRKSPAGMREENEKLMLQAQKEKYKTSIHHSKHARYSSYGMSSGSTRQPKRNKSYRSNNSNSIWASSPSYPNQSSHSYDGMNDLFGQGKQKPMRKSSKQPKAYSGMDDLF